MKLKLFATSGTAPQSGFWCNVFDVLLNVVVIVAVVAIIRTFIVAPFEVEGSSMISTLEDNQYIIIDKLSYFLSDPKRGDVVVFHPPPETTRDDTRKYYVKRIIGLPGEDVVIQKGKVFIGRNGKETELEEAYLDERNHNHTFRTPVGTGDETPETFHVPPGNYFLLGDNRQGSLDSRSFQYVARGKISGRVWLVALPITKSHALETPEYRLPERAEP